MAAANTAHGVQSWDGGQMHKIDGEAARPVRMVIVIYGKWFFDSAETRMRR
jgi:hypothetical protein